MNRSRRSAWNFLTSLGLIGTTIALGFIATPQLISWLGEESYGAFRATTDCYGYLSLLELGLDGALVAMISRALHKSGSKQSEALAEAGQVVKVGVRAYTLLTGLFVAVGLLFIIGLDRLVPVVPEHRFDLRLGAVIATLGFAFLPLNAFRTFSEVKNQGYIVNTMLLVQALLVTGLSLVLAYASWGIAGQFVAVTIGSGLFHVAIAALALKQLGGSFRKRPDLEFTTTTRRDLWRLNRPNFLMNFCGRASLMSDQIIISMILGPAAIVPFYITCRLSQVAQRVLQNIGNASWPALAEMHLRGENDTFNERLIELTRLTAILAVAGLLPIVVANHHFVALWVGMDRFAGHYTSISASGTTLILALVSLWGWCFTATGKPHMLARIIVIQTVLNLFFSILLTFLVGVRGPLLGTCIAQGATQLWYLPWLMHKTFGTPLLRLVAAFLVPVAWGVPYAVGVYWVFRWLMPFGWTSLIAAMSAAGLGFLLFSACFLVTGGQRQLWRRRLVAMIRPAATASA